MDPFLSPLDPEYHQAFSNLPLLGKVLDFAVAAQLQRFLGDMEYLDPVQSSFRPGFGLMITLVALFDNHKGDFDWGSVCMCVDSLSPRSSFQYSLPRHPLGVHGGFGNDCSTIMLISLLPSNV